MQNCGPACSKWFLVAINICIFLIGAAALAVGIWVAIDKSSLFAIVNTAGFLTPADLQGIQNVPSMFEVGSYVLIGIGGFMFFVGFAGCWGACKESKCLLWIYAFFVLVCFLFLLGSGILGAVFKGQVTTTVQQFMLATLNYSFDGQVNTSNPQSWGWYVAMQTFQCCGFYGPGDFEVNYTSLAYLWSSDYRSYCWPGNTTCISGLQVEVPTSCCMYQQNEFTLPSAMTDYNCPANPTANNSYTEGCQDAIQSWLNTNASIILAVAFALAGFLMVAMVAACCLIQAMENAI